MEKIKNFVSGLKPYTGFAVFILMALIVPVATISSLNSLFPTLNIPLNFDTYTATAFLLIVFTDYLSVNFNAD